MRTRLRGTIVEKKVVDTTLTPLQSGPEFTPRDLGLLIFGDCDGSK